MTSAQLQQKIDKSGLSAAQFAAKIGLNANHLRAVLRGERPVSDKLARLLDALDEQEQPERITAAVVSVRLPSGAASAHVAGADDLTPAELAQVWRRVEAFAQHEQARIEAGAELKQ